MGQQLEISQGIHVLPFRTSCSTCSAGSLPDERAVSFMILSHEGYFREDFSIRTGQAPTDLPYCLYLNFCLSLSLASVLLLAVATKYHTLCDFKQHTLTIPQHWRPEILTSASAELHSLCRLRLEVASFSSIRRALAFFGLWHLPLSSKPAAYFLQSSLLSSS